MLTGRLRSRSRMRELLAAAAFALAAAFPVPLSATGVRELNAALERRRIDLAAPRAGAAGDAEFMRRAYLKLTGTLPAPGEVRAFVRDTSPGKRAALIDRLLDSPAFAELTAMRYCQMFRVKSEFPINLWPNAVQLFHAYLRDAAATDRPYDKLVREMLTSSGSNFRVPGVNLLRAHADRSPEGVARGIALSLMGVRLEKLDRAGIDGMAAFFSRIGRKDTDEWKEEIIFTLPAPAHVAARTPTGESFSINSPAADPRAVFADWLVARDNPYFARAFANRAWSWFFGRGFVEPADDITGHSRDRMLSPSASGKVWTPATTPELDVLADIFRERGFRVKELCRVICRSSAFNAGWRVPASGRRRAEECFSAYPVHRMEPEVIIDALAKVTGEYDHYRSVIPEPFTFLPPKTPAVWIADGSISSVVLDNFGRSPRDTGRLDETRTAVTTSQRQWLMNSGVLYERLRRRTRRMLREQRHMNRRDRVDMLYLLTLSRFPTPEERRIIERRFSGTPPKGRAAFWTDLLWVLVNSSEFICHH